MTKVDPRWVAALATITVLVLSSCADDDAESSSEQQGTRNSPSETAAGEKAPEPKATEAEDGETTVGPTTREQAEEIAVDAVGEGEATWSGREDERGATWEVEVTRPDSSEVDVLVGEDGTIVAQIPKLADDATTGGGGGGGTGGGVGDGDNLSQRQAEQAALAAVGEGRVTWSGREDERGAAWEIEITRPDGSEVDVLIAADGSVVD